MPTRSNPAYRGYNDPGIAQGFTNIAKMFAPPSGADLYGYTRAAAEREKASRLAELYALSKDPNFDQTTFDRGGIAAGLYAPSQSFYSVDKTDASNRYKTDMEQTGQTTRSLLTPIPQGATRFVPSSVASFYGVDQTQMGNVAANQGETIYGADGRTYKGADKPLSETEQKARILAGLPPAQQNAIVFGNTPVETVRMPNGQVVPVTRPQMLDSGALPVSDKQAQIYNYKLPDQPGKPGFSGTAIYDPVAGGLVDSQTRAPLPAGAITYSAQLQGDKAATGLGPTTANTTDANKRAAEDTVTLNTLDLYETLIRQNPGVTGLVGAIRGTGQNAVAAAQDLAQAFGDKAPEMKAAADKVRTELSVVAPELFDPSIPQAQFLAGTLAYAIARTENPSGEVSRQAYDRALERVQGGMLSNQQEILAKLGAFRKVLQAKQAGTAALRDPSQARTDTNLQTPPVERWERDPATGQLRKVQ